MGVWGYCGKEANKRWGWAGESSQNGKGLDCCAWEFGCHETFLMTWYCLKEITLEVCQGWAWKGVEWKQQDQGRSQWNSGPGEKRSASENVSFHPIDNQLIVGGADSLVFWKHGQVFQSSFCFMSCQGRGGKLTLFQNHIPRSWHWMLPCGWEWGVSREEGGVSMLPRVSIPQNWGKLSMVKLQFKIESYAGLSSKAPFCSETWQPDGTGWATVLDH